MYSTVQQHENPSRAGVVRKNKGVSEGVLEVAGSWMINVGG